jgi:hypothetical protein
MSFVQIIDFKTSSRIGPDPPQTGSDDHPPGA